MALCDIYDTCQNLCGLWGKSGRKRMFYRDKTSVLQRRCGRRHVLPFDVFELFFVFKGTHIIHSAQFVNLTQSEFGFA